MQVAKILAALALVAVIVWAVAPVSPILTGSELELGTLGLTEAVSCDQTLYQEEAEILFGAICS